MKETEKHKAQENGKKNEHVILARYSEFVSRSETEEFLLPNPSRTISRGEASFDELIEFLELDATVLLEASPKRFSLKNVRPDVMNFLINQVRIPVSQRKQLGPWFEGLLERTIKVQSNEDFYQAFLEVVEEDPSRILHMIRKISVSTKTNNHNLCIAAQKALDNFAPSKLAIKTFARMENIIEIAKLDGWRGISVAEFVGVFFCYGMSVGMAAHDDIEMVEKSPEKDLVKLSIIGQRDEVSKLQKNADEESSSVSKVASPFPQNSVCLKGECVELLGRLNDVVVKLVNSPDLEELKAARDIVEKLIDWRERYDARTDTRELNEKLTKILNFEVCFVDIESKKYCILKA